MLYTINNIKRYIMLQVLVMYCYLCLYSVMGDQVMYPPPEFRRASGEMGVNILSVPNSNFAPHGYHVPRQQIIHAGAMQSQRVPNAEKVSTENPGFSINGFLNAMNELSGMAEEENQNLRAANRDYDTNKSKYMRENYNSWTPAIHESASMYVPPTSAQHQSTKEALPKFNLLEPVTTKMSSKMSGLMGLILALLGSGSGSDNLVMKGFKEVIIDGIVKPLMFAKGGLKVLISRLTIPFISLLLINLEVLITVWWLWDDCPQSQPMPYKPAYPQPVNYNYNYNSTYK